MSYRSDTGRYTSVSRLHRHPIRTERDIGLLSLFRFNSNDIGVVAAQLTALDAISATRAAFIKNTLRQGDDPPAIRDDWRELIGNFRTAADVIRNARSAALSGDVERIWGGAYEEMARILERAHTTNVEHRDEHQARSAAHMTETECELAALGALTKRANTTDEVRRELLGALGMIAHTATATSNAVVALATQAGGRNLSSPGWR